MKALRTKHPSARLICCFAAILMLCAGQSMADVEGALLTKSGWQKGMIRWQPSSKVYLLTKGPVSLKIKPRDVLRVRVVEPRGMKQLVKLVESGQYQRAVGPLEKIMTSYLMLEWDVHAASWLAECYLKMKNPRKAAEMCKKVIAANPDAEWSPGMAGMYWEALLADNQDAKLRRTLKNAIEKGSRGVVALALVRRGDLEKKKNNFEKALINGYLRAILLFEQEKRVQPEALYKAAQCFEELGRTSNAERARKKLLVEFPRDEYAGKLKAGM